MLNVKPYEEYQDLVEDGNFCYLGFSSRIKNETFEEVCDKKIDLISPLKITHRIMIERNTECLDIEYSKQTQTSQIRSFITQDPDLLNQYYKMRHDAYRDENGWKDYDGSESELDKRGHIIVALKNDKVVGGCRLMFSNECDYLSNEVPDSQYTYMPFIQKYDQREGLILSEISSVVVLKGYRDGSVSHNIFDVCLKKSRNHGCSYICAVGPIVECRDYRKIARNLGVDLEIVMKFIWKQKEIYNHLKMFFLYVKI